MFFVFSPVCEHGAPQGLSWKWLDLRVVIKLARVAPPAVLPTWSIMQTYGVWWRWYNLLFGGCFHPKQLSEASVGMESVMFWPH